MKKSNRIKAVLTGTAFFITLTACTMYVNAPIEQTYDVHTTYNGHKFTVNHDGEYHDYIVESDTLEYSAFKLSDCVSYDKMPEDLYKKIEDDTLVWVRFNDKGTPDNINDDVPEIIGYDIHGMNQKFINEIDEWIANNNEWIANNNEWIANYKENK